MIGAGVWFIFALHVVLVPGTVHRNRIANIAPDTVQHLITCVAVCYHVGKNHQFVCLNFCAFCVFFLLLLFLLLFVCFRQCQFFGLYGSNLFGVIVYPAPCHIFAHYLVIGQCGIHIAPLLRFIANHIVPQLVCDTGLWNFFAPF